MKYFLEFHKFNERLDSMRPTLRDMKKKIIGVEPILIKPIRFLMPIYHANVLHDDYI